LLRKNTAGARRGSTRAGWGVKLVRRIPGCCEREGLRPRPRRVAAEAARITRDPGPSSSLSPAARTSVQRRRRRLEYGPVWRVPSLGLATLARPQPPRGIRLAARRTSPRVRIPDGCDRENLECGGSTPLFRAPNVGGIEYEHERVEPGVHWLRQVGRALRCAPLWRAEGQIHEAHEKGISCLSSISW